MSVRRTVAALSLAFVVVVPLVGCQGVSEEDVAAAGARVAASEAAAREGTKVGTFIPPPAASQAPLAAPTPGPSHWVGVKFDLCEKFPETYGRGPMCDRGPLIQTEWKQVPGVGPVGPAGPGRIAELCTPKPYRGEEVGPRLHASNKLEGPRVEVIEKRMRAWEAAEAKRIGRIQRCVNR